MPPAAGVTARRTRASNANAHPGHVVLNATRKRRTKAQKAADDKVLAEELKAKEAAALEGIQRLANIQAEMEQVQAAAAVKKPKAVRPRPRPVAAKKMVASQVNKVPAAAESGAEDEVEGNERQGQLTSDSDKDDMSVDEPQPQPEIVTKQKPGKKSLKDAVDARLKSMKADQFASVDLADRKGNSLPSAVKSSVGGRIKAWASDIPSPPSCPSEGRSQLHSNSHASVPPSTIFSRSQATTAASDATSLRSQAISQKGPDVQSAVSADDLVGGFGDEEGDDMYEREAAVQITGQPVKIGDITDSESEDVEPGSKSMLNPRLASNSELPPPSSQLRMLEAARRLAAEKSNGAPPPSTQHRKPQAIRVASGTKRKLAVESSVEIVESLHDQDDSSVLSDVEIVDDSTMLVDEPQGMQDTPLTKAQALRTTSSTTVMTTDARVPPAKKVRIEPKVKPEPESKVKPEPKVKPKSKVKLEPKVKTEEMDMSDTALDSDGTWVEATKARSAYRNTDLPPACQDGHWPKVFLPTIYLWAGSQPNLWNISDDALLEAIKHAFAVVYPEVEYSPTLQGSVFGVTNQRLSEWRSNFGSTAIAIIIDFMARNDDTSPGELAEYLLLDYGFLYEDPDVIDKTKTFQSAFMLQLVATGHLHATTGHADVPALNTDALVVNGIGSVIGICAAAASHFFFLLLLEDNANLLVQLERALRLINDNVINVEDVLAAPPAQRKLMLKTPKALNKATGKETSTVYAFSVSNWGSATNSFSKSARLKGKNLTKDITSMARKLLKRSKSGLEDFLSNDFEELDERAMV
ncbi:hypothetical protein F4604DRAFT_1677762 [Suillus subluteus]|nr:hypothetical protein F4604DRAFT_1677762 [Suillus subluteus]